MGAMGATYRRRRSTRALAVTQAATMCAKKRGVVLGKAPTLDAINSICLEIDEIGLLVEHMDVLKLEGLTLCSS